MDILALSVAVRYDPLYLQVKSLNPKIGVERSGVGGGVGGGD